MAALVVCVSGLLGIASLYAPQPATDALLRAGLLAPIPADGAALVLVDGDAGDAAWLEAAETARALGAVEVGAVHSSPLPESILQIAPGTAPLEGAGLVTDGSGRARAWRVHTEQGPTLIGQLQFALGRPVPETSARLPLDAQGVPTLRASQLSSLAPGSLAGRAAVLGTEDPWSAPRVATPGGAVLLAEAVARSVAAPPLHAPSAPLAAFYAAAVGLTLYTLLAFRRRSVAALAVGGASAIAASLVTGGLLLPIELLIAAPLVASAVQLASHRRTADEQLQLLSEHVSWTRCLHREALDAAPTWQRLCDAAVRWGGAQVALAVDATGSLKGRAGDADVPLLVDMDPAGAPPRGFVGLRLVADGQVFGQLLLKARSVGSLERDALANAASWLAQRQLESISAAMADRSLDLLERGLRALADERELLLASREGHGGSMILFDPTGRALMADPRAQALLEEMGLSAGQPLVDTWSALGGDPSELVAVLSEGDSATLELGGGVEAHLSPCVYRDRWNLAALELVEEEHVSVIFHPAVEQRLKA